MVPEKNLSIELSVVPVLRNVAFHLHSAGSKPRAADVDALAGALSRRLHREEGLPSLAGGCLLMGGVVLLILPLWMLSQRWWLC